MFVIYVLSIINVIKLRPSAAWVLYFISLFIILCMVCDPSAVCSPVLLFPYNPVTFLLCLKILQSCNVFIIPCIYRYTLYYKPVHRTEGLFRLFLNYCILGSLAWLL